MTKTPAKQLDAEIADVLAPRALRQAGDVLERAIRRLRESEQRLAKCQAELDEKRSMGHTTAAYVRLLYKAQDDLELRKVEHSDARKKYNLAAEREPSTKSDELDQSITSASVAGRRIAAPHASHAFKLKRVAPGYYTGRATMKLDGTSTLVEVSISQQPTARRWYTGIHRLDDGGLISEGEDTHSTKRDAVLALEDTLRRGMEHSQWGWVLS